MLSMSLCSSKRDGSICKIRIEDKVLSFSHTGFLSELKFLEWISVSFKYELFIE